MDTVTESFNTTVRQMAEMSHWPKRISKKWPKCLSEKKQLVKDVFCWRKRRLHWNERWK